MAIYAVTGGAGFIGSHLVDALLGAGHRVRVLDDLSTGRVANLDPRVELILGDVVDPALTARLVAGSAGCFHLAAVASVARSNEDWLGTHRTNLAGTVSVLDAARRATRLPVVYASSAAIYGDQGGRVAHEAATPAPSTAYGADKLGSELHARVAYGVHGVPTTGLRFFNIYGPRQDPSSPYSGVISIFASRIAARQRLTIYGDGQQVRDFVHVSDVVAHLLNGMHELQRRPAAAVYNVCTGRGTTVFDLAHELGRVVGCKPEISLAAERSGDIRFSLGDPQAATAGLGVSARVGLVKGLATTLAALQSVRDPQAEPTRHPASCASQCCTCRTDEVATRTSIKRTRHDRPSNIGRPARRGAFVAIRQ